MSALSHVCMWKLDQKEGWVSKKWCFRTVVLEKILESPLDSKEIQPVNPKGNQSWIFIWRTDAEAPIVWPPDLKRPWCWERLKAGGKGDDRGWDGWMASLIQWTWVWTNSEIVKDREAWPAAVHGLQRVWHDWAAEQQQHCLTYLFSHFLLQGLVLTHSLLFPSRFI